MGKPVERILEDKPEGRLLKDLERYKKKTLELGADKATLVRVENIPVDERVTLKCQVPRCFGYGVSAHCPPNTLKPAELRELLKKYKWGVFFIKEVPSKVIIRDKQTLKERVAAYQEVYKIVSDVESMAFYDGYYLAFGLGAGSCRHTFCNLQKSCQALEGQRCRFSLIARPSMEAVGIDVYQMVVSAGWDIYPIGSAAKTEDVVKGTLAGIIIF